MKFCLFHLMPYAPLDLTFDEKYPSSWMALPNSYYDPKQGHLLYNRYLDELELGDQLGFDVLCVNEHHQTAYGLMATPGVLAGALSRRTKRARIAVLGRALPLLNNPLSIAEEYAILDNITGGRLIAGFVRGIGVEYHSTGANPAKSHERFHEAHDLILQAWTRTGPFPFEGKHYQFQYVNLWPRPYQQPHPPIWVTMGSNGTAAQVGERGHVGAVFLAGYQNVRGIFGGYREAYIKAHGKVPSLDRLAYLGLCFVGENEREAHEGAQKLMWYMEANKVPHEWSNPPGYHPPPVAAQVMKGRSGAGIPAVPKLGDQMQRGNLFAGTPDQVYEQIKAFWEFSGGFGNMMIMGQAGFLSDQDATKSMKLYAKEVYPRLRELTAKANAAEMYERSKALPERLSADTSLFGLDFVR